MPRMPVLFVGHGNPMNALMDNAYTRSLRSLGPRLPRPRAVCLISAHYLTRGETRVDCQPVPRQIFDFYGFPEALYRVRYQAPGAPEVARDTVTLLDGAAARVTCDTGWGHDHAAWSVLMHLLPDPVPVYEISVDVAAGGERHLEMGARLSPLRDRGVLILGSGNIVHNLAVAEIDLMDAPPDPAGVEFDAAVRDALLRHDADWLAQYRDRDRTAAYSVPTPDHYLPLLWAVGAADAADPVAFPCELFQNRSVSMRSVLFGN